MTHQTLSLEKYWKLFLATLNKGNHDRVGIWIACVASSLESLISLDLVGMREALSV